MSSSSACDDAKNMDIHPELAKLRQEYERITSDLEHGHIQEQEAREAIGNMWVFDETGSAWGIDLYGRFVRQDGPHAEPVPSSPHSYGVRVEDLGATRTVIDGQEWVIPDHLPQEADTGMRSISPRKKSIAERLKSIPVGERTKAVISANRSTLVVVAALLAIFVSVKIAGDNATPLSGGETVQTTTSNTTVTQERLNEILQGLRDPSTAQNYVVETLTVELATEVANKLSALAMTGTLNAVEGGVVAVAADGSVTAQVAWQLVLDNGVWRVEKLSSMFPK